MLNCSLKRIAFCALATFSLTVIAQSSPTKPINYPTRTITLIVPFAAGGYNDTCARIIAQKMSESPGWQVIVENRTGAGGIIGATTVAHASPDGYTLGFLSSGPLASNVSLYKTLPYDPVSDFVAIAKTAISPNVLVVNPSVPANNLNDFVAYLKHNPSKINYGTAGNGSSPHVSAVLFESMAGVKMMSVAYRGAGQLNPDLLGGHIQLTFGVLSDVIQYIRAGKLKALAVTSAKRSALLPDVPAMAEFYPGYEVLVWNGFVAPAGTSPDVVSTLNAEVVNAVNSSDVRAKLLQLGVEPQPSTPAEFAAYIKSEIAAFAKLAKLAGVAPQ